MLTFLETDKDLFKYSSFHTPAKAQYFFEIRETSDIEKLHDIWKFAQKNSLPIVFLGSGTNIVFAFDIFKGIIIRNTLKWNQWGENNIKASGGELISPLSVHISKKNNNSLFSKWIGLPGTVGGAVAGNAGCFWFEAKDSILEVYIFDIETGKYITLKNSELTFTYRHSLLKDKPTWFLVSAIFDTDLISDDTTDPRTFRSGKQPSGFTCGSFFRNPTGDSAGRLIDQVGLKWYQSGGVQISELHANFFVNNRKGTYKDILCLRDIAKKKVYEIFGVELQEEARIIENL